MNSFQDMLNSYLMIQTMKDAERWIKKQPCRPEKKERFLDICRDTLEGVDSGMSYEQSQDYVDSLRRDFSKEIGL